MSRYEQVCDMIRQRRELREKAAESYRERLVEMNSEGERLVKPKDESVFLESEILSVIQDALLELPPELFAFDAEQCFVLRKGAHGPRDRRRRCRLLYNDEVDWPLQSEMDA